MVYFFRLPLKSILQAVAQPIFSSTAKRTESEMDMPSPELKQLWIRVLKRVHPDLAIDEQDRIRCEQLTKLANEAYQAGDLEALRAVLTPPQPPMYFAPGTEFFLKRSLAGSDSGRNSHLGRFLRLFGDNQSACRGEQPHGTG